ncbi:MAG: hypothetical protein KJN67_05100 [Pontiella sp.]|nr:hypothetical protein [Pontiella sp.]
MEAEATSFVFDQLRFFGAFGLVLLVCFVWIWYLIGEIKTTRKDADKMREGYRQAIAELREENKAQDAYLRELNKDLQALVGNVSQYSERLRMMIDTMRR